MADVTDAKPPAAEQEFDPEDDGEPISGLDLKDPQVIADIERAKRASELAGLPPPGREGRVKMYRGPRTDRRGMDPRGPMILRPDSPVPVEVLKLVMGREMGVHRAGAVKRVVRRIRALMGADAPDKTLLKWLVAEIIGSLESERGLVRLGTLRTIAELIGLLRPGAGLNVNKNANANWVPRVTFTEIPRKQLAPPSEQKARIQMIYTPPAKPADFAPIPAKKPEEPRP